MSEALEFLKQRRAQLQGLVAEVRKNIAYLRFVPNDGQAEFLRVLDQGIHAGKRQFGAFWGNRVGKTQVMVWLAFNIALGEKGASPILAQYDWIKKWPFDNKRIRILCNSDQLKEYRGAIWQAIRTWWPEGLYEARKQGMDYDSVYILPNGWILDICTYDQPLDRHESVELSLVLCDEPPPRAVWYAYAIRLSKGGLRIIFATLVFEGDWVEPELIQNPDFVYTYADMCANCKQHAKVGYLEHEEIARMIATADPLEREARRTGHPMSGGRRVFNIVESVHCVPRSACPAPEDEGESTLVLDPHQQKPWVITVCKRNARHRFYAVEEWPTTPYLSITGVVPMTVADYAAKLWELKNKWRVEDGNMVIDAKFAKQTVRSNYDVTDLMQSLEFEFGLRFEAGNPHLIGSSGSIEFLRSALRYDPEKLIDFNNSPTFYICDELFNSIVSLKNLGWDKTKVETLDAKYLNFARNYLYAIVHNIVEASNVIDDPQKRRDKQLMEQLREQGEII